MKPAIDPDRFPVRTERLTLRGIETSDVPVMVEALSDFGVVGMLSRVPHPYTAADGAAFQTFANDPETDGHHLAVALDRRMIGVMSLGPFPEGELGYWLARAYWGKGYATEAAIALLSLAFREAPDAVILSGAFADNPASLRVQEKLGFEPTATDAVFSLSRQSTDPHIKTELTRGRFTKAVGRRAGI